MQTKCVLQRCITKGVSITTVIVKYDFFYYTYVFVSLYSFGFVRESIKNLIDYGTKENK